MRDSLISALRILFISCSNNENKNNKVSSNPKVTSKVYYNKAQNRNNYISLVSDERSYFTDHYLYESASDISYFSLNFIPKENYTLNFHSVFGNQKSINIKLENDTSVNFNLNSPKFVENKKSLAKFIAYKKSPRNGLKAISTSYVSVVIENDNNLYALGSNMFEIKDDYLAKHFQEMIDLFYKKKIKTVVHQIDKHGTLYP